MCIIVTPDGRGIGCTSISRHCLRHTMAANGHGKEMPGRMFVSVLGEQEVNRLPRFIGSAIEVAPLPFHPNVCLVHAPTHLHRPFTPVKRLLKTGHLPEDPVVDREVVDGDATLLHQHFQLAITSGWATYQRT